MHSYSDHANMWKQLGSAIVGAEVGDRFRYLVAINTNSTMFVTRAAFNNNSSCMSSHVRIYSYSVNTYVQDQFGSAIAGVVFYGKFGCTVLVLADGKTEVVGIKCSYSKVRDYNQEFRLIPHMHCNSFKLPRSLGLTEQKLVFRP